jgi:PhnB protein
MAIASGRPNTRQIAPHLIVRDGAAAVAFYGQAFGARELYRSAMPDGQGIHAQLRVFDSVVFVSDESMRHPDLAVHAPPTLGGAATILELYVDDVDAVSDRAVSAGATATLPPADTFFGDRDGWVTDPFGHIWGLASVREVLTPEQIAERMQAYASQM